MILQDGKSVKVDRTFGEWGTLKDIQKPRKAWTCRACGKAIAVGESHYSQNWHAIPGDVSSYLPTRIHADCVNTGKLLDRVNTLPLHGPIDVILKVKGQDYWMHDIDGPEYEWERLPHASEIISWIDPVPVALPHYKNGDSEARYYEACWKAKTIWMMQTEAGYREFLLTHAIPSQQKALQNEKEHAGVISFEKARLKKQQAQVVCPHDQTPMDMMGTEHDPDFRYLECPICTYTVEPKLVNFNEGRHSPCINRRRN